MKWMVIYAAALLCGGTAMAQTAAPSSPETPGSVTPAPNDGGIARGVVPPPKNIDPEMVTPPPVSATPTMPVIKPPVAAR